MHKNIGPAFIRDDEAESAICVEEFDAPGRHLRGGKINPLPCVGMTDQLSSVAVGSTVARPGFLRAPEVEQGTSGASGLAIGPGRAGRAMATIARCARPDK
jgi:hypothetical protein